MKRKKIVVYILSFIILVPLLGLSLFITNPRLFHFEKVSTQETVEKSVEEPKKNENLILFTDAQIDKLGLQTQEAGPKKLSLILSTRGKIVLHPDNLAHVVTKMPGIAKEANRNIGDRVRAGEVLAVLESLDMAQGKADYLEALSKEKHAETILNREKQLYERKISAGQDYFTALAHYEQSQITTQSTKQKLKASGIDEKSLQDLANATNPELRLYEVYAPINGVITSRHITKGEFIEDASTIYEIADLKSVWVEMGIYPNDLFKIEEGQKAQVTLPTDAMSAEAHIIYLSPLIDDQTLITKAIAELPNGALKWRPGMFVNVDIEAGEVPVTLAATKESIQTMEGQSCLFVRTPQGFERRFVKLGKSDQKHVEILSGVEPGEKCVAGQAFLLKAEIGKDSIKDDD